MFLEFKKVESKFSNLVTWTVFLITLVFVIITLTSAAFPNLLLSSFGGVEDHFNVDPIEKGMWAYPLLITNFVIFGLAFLYFPKKTTSLEKMRIRKTSINDMKKNSCLKNFLKLILLLFN